MIYYNKTPKEMVREWRKSKKQPKKIRSEPMEIIRLTMEKNQLVSSNGWVKVSGMINHQIMYNEDEKLLLIETYPYKHGRQIEIMSLEVDKADESDKDDSYVEYEEIMENHVFDIVKEAKKKDSPQKEYKKIGTAKYIGKNKVTIIEVAVGREHCDENLIVKEGDKFPVVSTVLKKKTRIGEVTFKDGNFTVWLNKDVVGEEDIEKDRVVY